MKRAEEFQTPLGQTAWRFYDFWFKAKNRLPPPAQSFLDSKYYMTLINFTKFVKSVNLPSPERFIKYMVERDYPPSMWITNVVYVEYLEYLDNHVNPMDHVKTSIDTILKLCEALQVDSSQIFHELDTYEVIDLIQGRQLSPWLLLFCSTFSEHYENKATPEQRVLIETLIRPEFWAEKFDQYPKELDQIKQYVQALDL
jgi:hypothetical protein